ncbi:unnamed protein product, partial [marine sediment metagenome]
MNGQPQPEPMPKKSCMVTLMFEIKDDSEAMALKKVIDDHVKNIDKKRYT